MNTGAAILVALLFGLIGAGVVYLWWRISAGRAPSPREAADVLRRIQRARRTVIEKQMTVGQPTPPRPRLSAFDEMWNLMESSMLDSVRESTAIREVMEVDRASLDLGAQVTVCCPDGSKHTFKIPPRTANPTTFRFKRVLSGGRDLYITVCCKGGSKPAN